MIEIIFTQRMKDILKETKGQQLKSLEYGKDPVENSIYGNFRLNIDGYAIDVTNEVKPQPFFDEIEDISGFACCKTDENSPFQPAVVSDSQIIPVAETITGVEIVTDEICVNHGEYRISFDTALIIRTANKTLMFTRDVWFSEVITFSQNDDYNAVIPVQDVAESWSNEGEYCVDVKRSKEVL